MFSFIIFLLSIPSPFIITEAQMFMFDIPLPKKKERKDFMAATKCAVSDQIGKDRGHMSDDYLSVKIGLYARGGLAGSCIKYHEAKKLYFYEQCTKRLKDLDSIKAELEVEHYGQKFNTIYKTWNSYRRKRHESIKLKGKSETKRGWCIRDFKDRVLASCWYGVTSDKDNDFIRTRMGTPSRKRLCCVPGHPCLDTRRLSSSNTTSTSLRGGLTITEFENFAFDDDEEDFEVHFDDEGGDFEVSSSNTTSTSLRGGLTITEFEDFAFDDEEEDFEVHFDDEGGDFEENFDHEEKGFEENFDNEEEDFEVNFYEKEEDFEASFDDEEEAFELNFD